MQKVSKANQAYVDQDDANSVKYYKEAIAMGANLQGTEHVQLADSLDSIGQTPEAIEQYKIALEKDPSQTQCYNYMAIALFQQGDIQGAEEAFRKCIELDPNDAKAHLGLSKVFKKLGKVDEGKKTAALAEEMSILGLKKASEKGLRYIKAGLKNKAFEVLLRALAQDEDETLMRNLQFLDLQEQIKGRKNPFEEKEVIDMLK